MSVTLRVLLLAASVVAAAWILIQIRKFKVKMEDAIFWIFFAAVLLVLAVFPEVSYWLSSKMGFMSPSNLVFLIMIFLLVEKIFTLSIIVSQLEDKISVLSAEMALRSQAADKRIDCREPLAGGNSAARDGREQAEDAAARDSREQAGKPAAGDSREQSGNPIAGDSREQAGKPAAGDSREQSGNPADRGSCEQSGRSAAGDGRGQAEGSAGRTYCEQKETPASGNRRKRNRRRTAANPQQEKRTDGENV